LVLRCYGADNQDHVVHGLEDTEFQHRKSSFEWKLNRKKISTLKEFILANISMMQEEAADHYFKNTLLETFNCKYEAEVVLPIPAVGFFTK